MPDSDIASFERWVAANASRSASGSDRVFTDGAAAVRNDAPPHLVSLATTVSDPPVVSHSVLVGANVESALTLDQAVQSARQTSGADSGPAQQALANSPATGCAMVLSLAQQASGFNPASPATAGNVNGYLAYVGQVLQCPIFTPMIRDQVQPSMSGDWNSVVDQIASYYVGLAPDQVAEIRGNLWRLAQAASSSPDTMETENLFVQSTLNADDQLILFMYQSIVQMATHINHGGKHSPDTVTNNAGMTLWRTVLRFESQFWPTYAPVIAAQTDASLESWLQDTTTPQGPVPVHWTV